MQFGFKKGKFQAGLEENKIASTILRGRIVGDHELAISPEFREYLKGRIYYNIATKFPNNRGYLLRRDWDFGPVDGTVFNGARVYAKDPAWACESFDDASSALTNAEPNE